MDYDKVLPISDISLITMFVFNSLYRLGYKLYKDDIVVEPSDIDTVEEDVVNDIVRNIL